MGKHHSGGARRTSLSSNQKTILQPSGKASFAHNAVIYFEGYACLSNSAHFLKGDVVSAETVVGESGGALYSNLSAMAFAETAVRNDISSESEGEGLLMQNSTLYVYDFGTAEYYGRIARSGGAIQLFNSRSLSMAT